MGPTTQSSTAISLTHDGSQRRNFRTIYIPLAKEGKKEIISIMNYSLPGPQSVPRASPSLYITSRNSKLFVNSVTASEKIKIMNCNQENLELEVREIPALVACVLYFSEVYIVVWILDGSVGVLECQKLGCGIPKSLSEDKCRR